MSSEIIQSVTYDNHDDFSTCQLHIFTKKFISLFWGLFNDGNWPEGKLLMTITKKFFKKILIFLNQMVLSYELFVAIII